MKKLIILLLSVIMTVSLLAGCSEKAEEKTTLTVGITEYKPMNYKENGEWTGFDTEFAEKVGEILGMEVKFQEIEWGQKYSELNSGAVDCLWNGFTANTADEEDGIQRSEKVDFSYSYMTNAQAVIVKADMIDSFKTSEDLKGKIAAYEEGSAGESFIKGILGDTLDESKMISKTVQMDALTEVKAGTSDYAVLDEVLAKSIIGSGDYADLAIVETITADAEEYAIGFKKGSELTTKVNEAIKQLSENGELKKLAEKYDLDGRLLTDFK